MLKLWQLEKGDKFVFVHDDGTVSDSPWYFYGTDGMYCKVSKVQNPDYNELQFVVASANVKKESEDATKSSGVVTKG